jgi:hypothetical protein
MKRVLLGGVLVVALVLGASVVANAMPASAVTKQDAASTRAFIALQERYDLDTIHAAPAVNTAEHAFAAQVRAGCLGVLAHLPKKLSNRQSKAMAGFALESFLALQINAFAPLRPVGQRIAARQRRLRFSDPALQWQVGVDGAENVAYFALRPPDLCTDGRLLVRSAFTRITAAGTRFVLAGVTVELSATTPSRLVRMMRSYAPAAAATALKRLPKLQVQLDRAIPIAEQSRALLRILGLKHRSEFDFSPSTVTS